MNIEQAKLLARMAEHIKTVDDKFIVPTIGVQSASLEMNWPDETAHGMPYRGCGCLINHAFRAGIVGREFDGADMPAGFSEAFGVTKDEAYAVIFHRHLGYDGGTFSKASRYYTAVKELLTKYGYAHLLEPEIHPVKQIIPAYKDQFTPASEGFDWRNPVAARV